MSKGRKTSTGLLLSATVTLLFLLAASWVLGNLLTPPVELTRFRNSLLASVGEAEDFNWGPKNIPEGFRLEKLPPPPLFETGVRDIRGSGEAAVVSMYRLVEHLRSRPKRKGPIQSTTVEAYSEIIESGRGYCADYTQVFNGLAYTAGIPVREWGLSFDRYSGDGHAFSEIYDPGLAQWVFVDPMHGFYVEDRTGGRPLSVLEFRDRLAAEGGFETLRIVPIANSFLFESHADAYHYYARGADQFFLWFGNDVFSYDAHPLVRISAYLSRPVEQLVAIAAGIHPQLRILPTRSNGAEIESLLSFRYRVIGLACGVILLVFVFVLQLWLLCRRQRRDAA